MSFVSWQLIHSLTSGQKYHGVRLLERLLGHCAHSGASVTLSKLNYFVSGFLLDKITFPIYKISSLLLITWLLHFNSTV